MNIAAFTLGPNIPSARARVRQYIPHLKQRGILVTEHPLPWGNALPSRKLSRPMWMAGTVASRTLSIVRSRSADALWISRQLLPAFIPMERALPKPFVLDVDDAVWLTTGGDRAKHLAKRAQTVVCGNEFLAAYFSRWNQRIVIIPTAIDISLYGAEKLSSQNTREIIIGWSGTSGNYKYLYGIEDALQSTLERFQHSKLLIVAEKPPKFKKLNADRVEFVTWTPAAELQAMERMTVGLMPLENSDWCRGKCSFKMLCYMASRIPVVVSPVGMNSEVLSHGNIGMAATTVPDWESALFTILRDPKLRQTMGGEGRQVVEAFYSLDKMSDRYSAVFEALQ